ncbi:MAG: DUF6756 family protein [Pseudomonadota bacterium]
MQPASQKRGKHWRQRSTYERAAVQQAILDLRLGPEEFRMIGIRDWQWIEERVQTEFYTRPYALRQRFPFTCIQADASVSLELVQEQLGALAAPDTVVYAAIGDEAHKLWWCKGAFQAAIAVFWEAGPAIDLLVVPESFEWFLTISHHDDVYTVGEPVSSRLVSMGAIRPR